MVKVLKLADDGLTHLSRLGVLTLCGERTKFEGSAGPMCVVCAAKAAESKGESR